MKRFLTPLLFTAASLTTISVNAGVAATFIPNEPTITAPTANAIDVDITPELTSSEFSFTKAGGIADPTLSASNWVVSKKSDNITILGSEKRSNGFPEAFSLEYDIPFEIKISGQIANKVRLTSSYSIAPDLPLILRKAELISTSGNIVAMSQILLPGFDFREDTNFLIQKTFSDSVFIQWHLKDTQGAEGIAEFFLIDGGSETKEDVFGWRITPNEYTNPLFDQPSSGAACFVAQNKNDTLDQRIPSTAANLRFPEWKENLSEKYNNFFLACTSKNGDALGQFAIQLKVLNTPDPDNLFPKIKVLSSSTESYTLSDSEALDLNTEYKVQAQHIGTSNSLTGNSAWSSPTSFTTRSTNTNYQVTVPTDLAFTIGTAKDLAFSISNSGLDEGSPKAIIRLPFNVLDGLNGTLKDFFNVSVGEQNCTMSQSNGKTDFTCQLDNLKSGDRAELTAKVTVKDTVIKSIEYKVCDAEKCDATDFTALNITVKTPTDPAPTDPAPTDPAPSTPAPGKTETKSSSSSSGGSVFWLFLMAPLLLVRRK